jgi:GDP-4-dehydro-6-deoxy-D-mannose reductase
LLRAGWELTGTTTSSAPQAELLDAEERAAIRWRSIDLRPGVDRRTVRSLLERDRPDAVFHLAAISFVPAANADPLLALETNVGSTVRLLEGMREMRRAGTLDPTLLVVGSAEQYGRHEPDAMPLVESCDLRPRTIYAATKCAQEAFGLAAARAEGLRVVATRSFNHSGVGQDGRFLLPSLVARVQARRADPTAPISVGNVDTIRDFLHVEDVASAYIALVQRGRIGEAYNVCSGVGVSVEALAAEVLARAGIEADLYSDPSLQRPVEVPLLVGDNSKLCADTGWAPTRTRTHIIDDLLNAAA